MRDITKELTGTKSLSEFISVILKYKNKNINSIAFIDEKVLLLKYGDCLTINNEKPHLIFFAWLTKRLFDSKPHENISELKLKEIVNNLKKTHAEDVNIQKIIGKKSNKGSTIKYNDLVKRIEAFERSMHFSDRNIPSKEKDARKNLKEYFYENKMWEKFPYTETATNTVTVTDKEQSIAMGTASVTTVAGNFRNYCKKKTDMTEAAVGQYAFGFNYVGTNYLATHEPIHALIETEDGKQMVFTMNTSPGGYDTACDFLYSQMRQNKCTVKSLVSGIHGKEPDHRSIHTAAQLESFSKRHNIPFGLFKYEQDRDMWSSAVAVNGKLEITVGSGG